MGILILVRHGENDWSKKNKLAGLIPGVHLNESGHQQAQNVAQRLAPLPIKAVYSSPVTRCLETAVYIANTHSLPVQKMKSISEVEYGEWEGKKIKKLAQQPLWRTVQFFPSRMRFPKGEAMREVQFRAIQAIEEIAARHEKEIVVVVSHADIIRLVLAHYLGIHMDLFQRLIISPASASVLALDSDGGVRVLRVNDDGPMQAAEPPKEKKKRKNKKAMPEHDEEQQAASGVAPILPAGTPPMDDESETTGASAPAVISANADE
jgi:probable phosphoglycerate mutase